MGYSTLTLVFESPTCKLQRSFIPQVNRTMHLVQVLQHFPRPTGCFDYLVGDVEKS